MGSATRRRFTFHACAKLVVKHGALSWLERRIRQRGALGASYLPGWREEPFASTEIACAGHPRQNRGLFKNRPRRSRRRCAPPPNVAFPSWQLYPPLYPPFTRPLTGSIHISPGESRQKGSSLARVSGSSSSRGSVWFFMVPFLCPTKQLTRREQAGARDVDLAEGSSRWFVLGRVQRLVSCFVLAQLDDHTPIIHNSRRHNPVSTQTLV